MGVFPSASNAAFAAAWSGPDYFSGGAGAPAFTPSSLSPQMWIDPSDLSTMFQDTAGTTPITTDGQSVARISDKSGNGRHWLQASAVARPLYKTDGTLRWLLFDGVDDGLSAVTSGLAATSVFVGGLGSGAGTIAFIAAFGGPNVLGVAQSGAGTSADSGAGTPTYRANKVGISNTRAALYTAIPSGNVGVLAASAANLSTWTSYSFGNFAGFPHAGKYFGHVVTPALSSTDRDSLETWMGAKCGLVI